MLVIWPKLPLTEGGLPVSDPMPLLGVLIDRVVEQVVSRRPKDQGKPFPHRESLLERGVDFIHPRTASDVAPEVPPGSVRGKEKAAGLNPLWIV